MIILSSVQSLSETRFYKDGEIFNISPEEFTNIPKELISITRFSEGVIRITYRT